MQKRFYRVMIRRTPYNDLIEWDHWPTLSEAAEEARSLLGRVAVETVVMSVKGRKERALREYAFLPPINWSPLPFYSLMARKDPAGSDFEMIANYYDIPGQVDARIHALEAAIFYLWTEEVFDVIVRRVDESGRADIISGGYPSWDEDEHTMRINYTMAGYKCRRAEFWLPSRIDRMLEGVTNQMAERLTEWGYDELPEEHIEEARSLNEPRLTLVASA